MSSPNDVSSRGVTTYDNLHPSSLTILDIRAKLSMTNDDDTNHHEETTMYPMDIPTTRDELLERLEQALKAEAFDEAREYQALLDALETP